MKTPRKTVAIVDPRWDGHHPTYFREFVSSMLRIGARVIALCPDRERFAREARELCRELDLDSREWVVVEHLEDTRKSLLFPGKEHDPVSTLVRWFRVRNALRRAEKVSGWRADLVFFAWLDSYLRFLPHRMLPGLILRRSWEGLYFRNHHLASRPGGWVARLGGRLTAYLKGDFNLRGNGCRGVGVLDERFEEDLRELCRKPVLRFPDVTDVTLPKEDTPIVREIKELAKGRKIVGMVGLEKRKGLLTLLKTAIRAAEDKELYFVFAGALNKDRMTDEELQWLRIVDRAVNVFKEFDNIYINLDMGRLPEHEFNSLFSATDVIFAAYEDFHGSSNALTKAAYFEKPVLASKGECMEKRVQEYRMGICIEQGNVDECLAGIRKLLEGMTWEEQPLESRFAAYRKTHSRERLDEVFREALNYA